MPDTLERPAKVRDRAAMTIEFLPDVAERLRILAEREERTKASLIREAVRKLLAERENAA